MTAFFRENGLKAGDIITLIRDPDDSYSIKYVRSNNSNLIVHTAEDGTDKKRLVLGSNWKVIEC